MAKYRIKVVKREGKPPEYYPQRKRWLFWSDLLTYGGTDHLTDAIEQIAHRKAYDNPPEISYIEEPEIVDSPPGPASITEIKGEPKAGYVVMLKDDESWWWVDPKTGKDATNEQGKVST